MVIRVGKERVYRFSENSTVLADVRENYAYVLVLPDRRRFHVSIETPVQVWREYGNAPTPQETLARYLSDGLRNGYLLVDEEVLS